MLTAANPVSLSPIESRRDRAAQRCVALVLSALVFLSLFGTQVRAMSIPPGNSAADQYVEAYPWAGGHKPSAGQPNGGAGSGNAKDGRSGFLGSKKVEQFQARGETGQAAAELAARTAPRLPRPEIRDGGGVRKTATPTTDSSGIELLSRGLVSSDGMGPMLPAILIAALAGAAAFGFARARHGSPG